MAIITCAECGHGVSDKAAACPTCGAPPVPAALSTNSEPPKIGLPPGAAPRQAPKPKQKKLFSFWKVAGFFLFVVVLFSIFGLESTPEQIAEREARAAERAAAAEEAAAAEAAEEALERSRGFHCLSAWNGSHRLVVEMVENALRNPDSFEHVGTRVTPIDENGRHRFIMQYRAENGFGGMNAESVSGTYANDNCNDVRFD